MVRAIYPGSFDPITYGHIDIAKRAAELFDELYVVVMENKRKNYTFTIEERVEMVKECLKDLPNVRVDTFSGLLVEYTTKNNIKCGHQRFKSSHRFRIRTPDGTCQQRDM